MYKEGRKNVAGQGKGENKNNVNGRHEKESKEGCGYKRCNYSYQEI